jgi:hypothetical protein
MTDDDDLGGLVSDNDFAKEIHSNKMGLHRNDNDPAMAELNWPVKIKRGSRNFRYRAHINRYKQTLLRIALANRAALLEMPAARAQVRAAAASKAAR